MGGFFFFFYMFFALTTSVYRDYKLETEIQLFEEGVNKLALMANQKPSDLKYLQSDEYKDRYAKESLNLLNPGEKLIILPRSDQHIEQGPVELMTDILSPNAVLNKPNNRQWWEYFFGNTLSVKAPVELNIPTRLLDEEFLSEPAEG